jgi:predicted nucleic acid-binding protein
MPLRVYLDTSVFSAYYDDAISDRRTQTEDFWKRRSEFELSTSVVAREELEQTPDPARRTQLITLVDGVTVHPVTDMMRSLARSYIDAGVFTAVMYNDAVHVAAAVLTRQDVLLSWNFRHLVNRRRRAQINEVNISLGLPTIDIVAPPEV